MTVSALQPVVETALAQVLALVSGITGVGAVPMDGEPMMPDWPTSLVACRQLDGHIEGWFVYPEVEEIRAATRETHATLRFLVRGFTSVRLDEGSRAAFRATVARLWDACRTTTLGGTVERVDPPVSRLDSGRWTEDRLITDVLCHVAELELAGHVWVAY